MPRTSDAFRIMSALSRLLRPSWSIPAWLSATREGLLPIVTVTSGLTLRTKVRAPKDLESPDMAWFVEATEILGDWGLDLLDPEMDTVKRIDALLLRIDAHPDHEELHQALEQACRDAAKVSSS